MIEYQGNDELGTYFEHFKLLVVPPFEIDSIDPKND